MKVSKIVETRRVQWERLEELCNLMASRSKPESARISEFSRLYREACADLALAEAYHLPPNTVQYLNQLVGRAHSQIYKTRGFSVKDWPEVLLIQTPQKIMKERCVHFAFALFWFLFLASAILSYNDNLWPGFAEEVLGQTHIDNVREMYTNFEDFSWETNSQRTSMYIYHNTGIGLSCFASSILILPGLVTLAFNAVYLGGTFGVMFRPDVGIAGENFRNFTTAHGPFELTAIVLSSGAGLRIGISWLVTGGLSRTSSVRKNAKEAVPIAGCAICLFVLAAFIEGFISPSTWLSWEIKGFIALLCSFLLTVYFVVLGYPRGGQPDEI